MHYFFSDRLYLFLVCNIKFCSDRNELMYNMKSPDAKINTLHNESIIKSYLKWHYDTIISKKKLEHNLRKALNEDISGIVTVIKFSIFNGLFITWASRFQTTQYL